MYDICVIASTVHDRQHLLERSLRTWVADAASCGLSVAIRVYGDGCGVRSTVTESLTRGVDFDSFSSVSASGSHVTGYNYWHSRVDASVYVFTHPEILFPAFTLRTAYESVADTGYASFKCFWMPESMTNDLDRHGYEDVAALERHPLLYPRYADVHPDFYFNSDIRGITSWDSTTTYAVNAPTSRLLFPLPAFSMWGPDDPYMAAMRTRLGIVNRTVMEPVLFHQWHPHGDIDMRRVMDEARGAL